MKLDWFFKNQDGFQGQFLRDEPLSKHTYYRIGGPAALLLAPKTRDDLNWIFLGLKETGTRFSLLGVGSNTLASDQGFDGVVIKSSKLDTVIEEISGQADDDSLSVRIRCGSSVAISTLLRRAGIEGWGSFDLWTGIPGSVGGAVAMNAGTHLGETADILESFEIFDFKTGQFLELRREEVNFAYRYCEQVTNDRLVVSAIFRSRKEDPAAVFGRIQQMLARRKATQPVDYPSCGSVFKNPKESGLHAWQVIEKIGLRGHQVGQAQFSEKHCNFIINLGKASAADVLVLINEAKKRAHDQLGIELHEEVKFLT